MESLRRNSSKEERWSWKGVSFHEFSLCRLKKSLQMIKVCNLGFYCTTSVQSTPTTEIFVPSPKVSMDFVRSYFDSNEPLTSWTLFSSLFFQISTDLEKKWWPKSSTGQGFICTEVCNFLQNTYFRKFKELLQPATNHREDIDDENVSDTPHRPKR